MSQGSILGCAVSSGGGAALGGQLMVHLKGIYW